ncbi:hypothetical protein BaRGS_00035736, partial [Batillaria attramentaria]
QLNRLSDTRPSAVSYTYAGPALEEAENTSVLGLTARRRWLRKLIVLATDKLQGEKHTTKTAKPTVRQPDELCMLRPEKSETEY